MSPLKPTAALALLAALTLPLAAGPAARALKTERLAGEGLWIAPRARPAAARGPVFIEAWFAEQLLGDGAAYERRGRELRAAKWTRSELRAAATRALKAASKRSFEKARASLGRIAESGLLQDLERHWIVNGFSARVDAKALERLASVPGLRKVFYAGKRRAKGAKAGPTTKPPTLSEVALEATAAKPVWYVEALRADRVWKRFGVTGTGVLNVIHDGHFELNAHIAARLYTKPGEVPGNGRDDDGNGLVDDAHGWNFNEGSARLTPRDPKKSRPGSLLHGANCAAIVCAPGLPSQPRALGLAPGARWAGVIAGQRTAAAIEWAVEAGADTYSMSFSRPGLGELRSHWRKMLEHGSLCGVIFVSGAGNYAKEQPIPRQMRTPEDIPGAVFAAAGVRRDLSRAPFSSQGPVEWDTEHYKDGRVAKPEICAFNTRLVSLDPKGGLRKQLISGNSFAGPMYCGAIALLLSCDPELLPWELREILTKTARDVAAPGFDHQTGRGLIDCEAAVAEALRRKAGRKSPKRRLYNR